MTDEGAWVGLFSGGKDSSWALYRALERGLPVERLVTVHPDGDSYMYHVPATDLARFAAESIGIELVEVRPDEFTGVDSTQRGDAELEPLEWTLQELGDELEIAGLTVGAVASEYQHSRVSEMADRLDVEVFAPLWQAEPYGAADAMLDAGFEIRIVAVAAAGLDESWLGRRLDATALAELETLEAEYGVHPLGEGGEFETLVTDGPHMERRLELEYSTAWEGTRGHLDIESARLAPE